MKKACLLLLLFLCSCATWREGNVPPVGAFPDAERKASIGVFVKYTVQFADYNPSESNMEKARLNLQKKIITRFNDSGLFSSVSADSKNEKYVLKVEYTAYSDMNFLLQFLTGFTLGIVPSYTKDTITVTSTLVNNKTKKSEWITLNDSATTYWEILLLPLTPFMNPISDAIDMENDLIDNLALQVYEKIRDDDF